MLLDILEILPEGIIFIGKDQMENSAYIEKNGHFEINYSNQQAQKMFNCENNSELIQSILTLELIQTSQNPHLATPEQKQSSVQSVSSFISFAEFLIKKSSKTKQKIRTLEQTNQYTNHKSEKQVESQFQKQNFESFCNQILSQFQSQKSTRETFESIFFVEVAQKNIQLKNQLRTIEINCFVVEFNEQPQVIIICRDISHRNYIQELADYCKQKSQMLSFVSHEYRTPLSCIISMLQEAIDQDCLENQSHLIKYSLSNAKYLLCLSNDLLDWAQIKQGKFKVNNIQFNLKELVQECIQTFQLMATQKQIELILQYDQNVPSNIISDPNRIKQIIINLLANAFKFTISGSITIIIKLNGSNLILIKVRDTGIGIKEEDQSKLFKAFGKLDDEYSKKLNSQGVGLGLVISNQIASMLGNNPSIGLNLSSEFKQGTTFWFQIVNHLIDDNSDFEDLENQYSFRKNVKLYMKIQSLQGQYLSPKFLSEKSFKFFKQSNNCNCIQILYVDDNQFNIDIFQLLLNNLSVNQQLKQARKCDFTISGLIAEEMVRKKFTLTCCKSYKIIFMDIEMPFQDGKQTTKNIRQFYKENNIESIIIGCSAYNSIKEKNDCLNAGMNDYLVKPLNIQVLDDLFQNFC